MRIIISILIVLAYYSCSSCQHSNQIKNSLEYRANLNYDAQDYEKAIPLFDSLILLDPTKGEFSFKRGFSRMQMDNSIPFDTAMRLSNKELLHLKEQKYMPTIKDFLAAIKFGFRKKVAYLNLGVIYTFVDDNVALDYFTKSLKEDSNYDKAKYELELCKNRIQKNQHFY